MSYQQPDDRAQELFSVADELRAIAQLGLHYNGNEYDISSDW